VILWVNIGSILLILLTDMKTVFPTLKDDWGIYIPEVKYLSPEPLVSYKDLSLTKFSNVHFVGDALSARGITVSGAQAIYVAESLLEQSSILNYHDETWYDGDIINFI
jgi:uncharacterized FAD-dependent dehydrogenase